MSDIQRYEPWPQEWPMEDANGDLVTYEDHRKVVEAIEAKLAKAVEALEYYAGRVTYRLCDDCPVQVHKSADLSGPARATLAEIKSGVATTPYGLKGESHE